MLEFDPKKSFVSHSLSDRQIFNPDLIFKKNNHLEQTYKQDSYGISFNPEVKHQGFISGLISNVKETGKGIWNKIKGNNIVSLKESKFFRPPNPRSNTIQEGWTRSSLNGDKLLNLNGASKASRINVISGISQIDSLGVTTGDKSRCGATAITSAIIYSQGDKGLVNLIDSIKSTNQKWQVNTNLSNYNLDNIKSNLQMGNSISRNDISKIQDALYQVMNKSENNNHPYLMVDTLKNFINANEKIKNAFSQDNMSVKLVDVNNNGTGDHYVLFFKHQGNDLVYDPWSRGENKQVITDNNTLNLYKSMIKE